MSGSKRRRYNATFKRNAISLAEEPGRSAHSVATSLGVANRMIGKWRRQISKNGLLAFPDNGEKRSHQIRSRYEISKNISEILRWIEIY